MVFSSPSKASAEINLDITLWDILVVWPLTSLHDFVYDSLGLESFKRSPLEVAIDLEEDTPDKLQKKISRIDNILNGQAKPGGRELSFALKRASKLSSEKVVRRFINAGADVSNNTIRGSQEDSKNSFTTLMEASNNPDPLVIKALLDAGADYQVQYKSPVTPWQVETALTMAAGFGNVRGVKILLDHAADKNDSCNRKCSAPLISAIEGLHKKLTENIDKYHTDYRAKVFAREQALGPRYDAVVRLLLERGADVNGEDENVDKTTPLLTSILYKGSRFVPLLLEHGAKVDISRHGFFPLGASADMGELTVLKLLLQQGANRFSVDNYGRNALDDALRGRMAPPIRMSMIEQLIDFGLTVSSQKGGKAVTLTDMWSALSNTQYFYTKSKEDHMNAEAILVRLVNRGIALDDIDNQGRQLLVDARAYGYQLLVDSIEQRVRAVD